MNKNRYRIIFSKAKNMFVAVAENVKSQTKTSGQTVAIAQSEDVDTTPFHQTWQVKSLVASMSLMMSIAPVYAQIIADPAANAANRPIILAGKNAQGTVVPVVNIQTPKNGVSHNIYKQFDVMAEGAVLNNSIKGGTSAIVDTVGANAYLEKGVARVILNEVNSAAASQFKGNLVVAGQTADVIIANPSGINIQGGGFINANKAIFTTGKPQLNADGSIKQFVVDQGKVTVLGGTGSISTKAVGLGGNNNDANYVDIYARALDASAEIRAKQGINVITGANTISEDLSGITPKTSTVTAPTIAIDVKALGGMYANNIYIIGNEKGLGVTNAGKINAVNNLVITSAGKIENKGNLASTSATQSLVNIQTTQTGANGDINNSGTIASKGVLNIESKNNINHTANEIKVDNGVIAPLILSAAGNINISSKAKVKNFGTDKGDIYLDAKNIAVGETAEIGTNGSIYLDAKESITAAKSSVLSARYDLDLEAKNKITLESTALTGNNANINIKTTNTNKAQSSIIINNGSISSSKDLNIFSTGDVSLNQIGLSLESATNKVSRVKNLNLYSGNILTLDFSTTVLPLISGKVQAEAVNKVELKGATLSTKDNINLQANQLVVGSGLNSQKEINLNAKVNDLNLTKNLTAVGNINVSTIAGGITTTSINATSTGGQVNLISNKNLNVNGTATAKSTLSGAKGVTISSLNQGAIAINNTNLTSSAGAILVNTEGKNTLTDTVLNATGNIEIFAKDNLTLDGITSTSKAHTALNSKKNVYINSSAGTADAPVFTSAKTSQLASTGSLSVTSGTDINLQNAKLTGGAVLVEAGGSFNPNKAVELNATGSDLLKNNTKLSIINGDLTIQTNKTLNIDPKKLTLKATGDIDLVSKAGDLNLLGYGGTTGNGSEQVVKLNTTGGGVNLEGKNINIEGSQIAASKDIKIVSSDGNVVIGGVRSNFSNKVVQSKLNDYRLQKNNIENQIKLISTQYEADKKKIQQTANLFIIRVEETYNGKNGAEWGDFIKEKNAMYSLINDFERKYNTKVNVREEWDEVDPDYLNNISLKYEQPFGGILNELTKEILLFENALNGYEHIGSNLKTTSGNINITSNKGTQITGSEITATNGTVNIEARAPLAQVYKSTTIDSKGNAKSLSASIIMDGLADFYEKGKDTDTDYSFRRLISPTVINGSKGVTIKAVGSTANDNLVLQATGIVAQNGDVKIQANKNILFDAAVETSYDRSTKTEKKKSWGGLKKKYITTKVENEDANAASVDVQAKNIYIESKEQNPNNSIDIYSGKFTADGGKISIRSGGKLNFYTVQESSSSQTDITKKGSFAGIRTGTSKTSTTREVLSELPTTLKADYIGAKSGYDMRLEGTEFQYLKGATLESGGKIELFPALTKITDITKKEKSSIVWQSMQDKGSITETGKLPSFNGPTPPTFQAAGGISVQIPVSEKDQNKVVLRDEILKLANQPGNAYLKDFVNRKDVDWNKIILAQKDWDYKSQGLTGAAAAIIVIIVAIVTYGAGAVAAGGAAAGGAAAGGGAVAGSTTVGLGASMIGTAGVTTTTVAGVTTVSVSTLGAMANAAIASIASNASISLINNGGDLSQTFKDLGSKESVKGLATSVITAGVISGLSNLDQIKKLGDTINTSTDFMTDIAGRTGQALINSSASAVVSTAINGGSLSENLKAALLNGLATSLQGSLSEQIGIKFDIENKRLVDEILHKIAHIAAGCVAGAIQKQCEAGAIGAGVGEGVADFFIKPAETASAQEKNAFRVKVIATTKVISGTIAALTGYDVNIAAMSAESAVSNNYLTSQNVKNLRREIADCKSQSACLKDIQAKYFGGNDSKGNLITKANSIWGKNEIAYENCTTLDCKIYHATLRESGNTEIQNGGLGQLYNAALLNQQGGVSATNAQKNPDEAAYLNSVSKVLSFIDTNCNGTLDSSCQIKWNSYQDKQLKDQILLTGTLAALAGGVVTVSALRSCLSNLASCNVSFNLAIDALFADGAIYGPAAAGVGTVTRNQLLREAEKLKNAYARNVLKNDNNSFLTLCNGIACFVAGTLVETDQGLKPIETFVGGELVWSRNDLTMEYAYQPVIGISRTENQVIYEVKVLHPNGNIEILETTSEHPFWVKDIGWLKASLLKSEMVVFDRNNQPLTIVSQRLLAKVDTVYNIEVEYDHTYHVGELGVWVHNTCCTKAELANVLNSLSKDGQGNTLLPKDLAKIEQMFFSKNMDATDALSIYNLLQVKGIKDAVNIRYLVSQLKQYNMHPAVLQTLQDTEKMLKNNPNLKIAFEVAPPKGVTKWDVDLVAYNKDGTWAYAKQYYDAPTLQAKNLFDGISSKLGNQLANVNAKSVNVDPKNVIFTANTQVILHVNTQLTYQDFLKNVNQINSMIKNRDTVAPQAKIIINFLDGVTKQW